MANSPKVVRAWRETNVPERAECGLAEFRLLDDGRLEFYDPKLSPQWRKAFVGVSTFDHDDEIEEINPADSTNTGQR